MLGIHSSELEEINQKIYIIVMANVYTLHFTLFFQIRYEGKRQKGGKIVSCLLNSNLNTTLPQSPTQATNFLSNA